MKQNKMVNTPGAVDADVVYFKLKAEMEKRFAELQTEITDKLEVIRLENNTKLEKFQDSLSAISKTLTLLSLQKDRLDDLDASRDTFRDSLDTSFKQLRDIKRKLEKVDRDILDLNGKLFSERDKEDLKTMIKNFRKNNATKLFVLRQFIQSALLYITPFLLGGIVYLLFELIKKLH